MTSIQFTYPWLLFIAIPLIGLSLIPYFKTAKKYRRTRNRVISLVLHCVTIVLATLALSGMTFVQTISNTSNELILVVDVSDTQQEAAENRDGFINDVLKESVYQNFSVGVVTFGLTQVYAVPLTSDAGAVYSAYKKAELPDTSATDIEAALEYARTLFRHPESGKILLVTDAKETDGNVVASSVVSGIVAQGTKLDTVFVPSSYEANEFQIVNLKVPDVQVKVGTECTLEATIFSREDGNVRINLYDNGNLVKVGKKDEETNEYTVRVSKGTQVVPLVYKFEKDGIHELKAELVHVDEGAMDEIGANNTYFTYANLEVFKKVLVIEAFDGDSLALKNLLQDPTVFEEGEEYEVSVYSLQSETVTRYEGENAEDGVIPQTVDDLREYDQIILNNIANADLVNRDIPLDKLLYSYVYEYGGGMLTVGGSDPVTGEAHAYNRKDMYGKDYQKMLPVEAVNYTPPAGVFIIVDKSGSMSSEIDGFSKLYWAQVGATACLGALEERDQIGILTLGNNYSAILPLTPRTEDNKIREAISSIGDKADGGTSYTPSVRYAINQLRAAQMEKNHIIIVSDGEVTDDDMEGCMELAKEAHDDEKLNLTISMVIIGNASKEVVKDLVCVTREEGWIDKINANEPGCGYYVLDNSSPEQAATQIAKIMVQDLNVKEIKEINYKPFKPIVFNKLSQVVQGIGMDGSSVNVTLNGYYGVKKRNLEGVDLILTGEYQVPIYARWKYGKGSVGSFMCDLKGSEWSGEFMNSAVGKQLIYNIIDDLMPVSNIRPQELNATLNSKNYSNHLNCPARLEEGESVRGTIIAPDGSEISLNEVGQTKGVQVKRALSESNKYSVCEFLITEGGVYTIRLQKTDAEGNVLASTVVYKDFSYSKEYDVEYGKTDEELQEILLGVAKKGEGEAFAEDADASLIFRDFITELRRVFDPRLILMIIAVLLFLLDVAVRKFKFKWIHEIVRERKEKRGGTQKEDSDE